MAKKDNQELKNSIVKEREAKIIPIKKRIYLYKIYGTPETFNNIQIPGKIPRYSESIDVKFVNIGKNVAIEIEIFWDKPKKILKNEHLTHTNIEVWKSFFRKYDKVENVKIEKEYINLLEEVEIGLHIYTEIYIKQLASELIYKFMEENKNDALYLIKHIQYRSYLY